MFCPKCGTQLPDGSTFCSQCGSQIKAVAKSSSDASPVSSFVSRARASASSGVSGVPLELTPGKIVPLASLGIVFILSFFPWVDVSTIYTSRYAYGVAGDIANAFSAFGVESSYSLWSLPALGDMVDSYVSWTGYSSGDYSALFMWILGVFILLLAFTAIGAGHLVITGKRLMMNIGLMLLFVFSGIFFLCFVLARIGGVIPVILFSAVACIVGIIGSGLDTAK